MLRALLHLLSGGSSRRRGGPGPQGRFRSAQFASFMAQNNRRRVDTDLLDAVLRSRRLLRNLLKLTLAGGGAWVVVESARALSIF